MGFLSRKPESEEDHNERQRREGAEEIHRRLEEDRSKQEEEARRRTEEDKEKREEQSRLRATMREELATKYPVGFHTTYLGQTVYVVGSWAESNTSPYWGTDIFLRYVIAVAWMDKQCHEQTKKVIVADLGMLEKILPPKQPKRIVVGKDPEPLPDGVSPV